MSSLRVLKQFVDSHGRQIRKLRVSLLDACNFRCFYCMPMNAKFMDAQKWLTPSEIESVCFRLIQLGIQQIRITGGEPTLRPEFREITERLSHLNPGKLGMTTNGFYLADHLEFLRDTKCHHINVSLDSLSRENFKKITRRDAFDSVLDSILRAKEMGFCVKVNTVLMRGVNDHELWDFVRFSRENQIEVRFLEVMKIGQVCDSQEELFIPAEEAISRLREKEVLKSVSVDIDSTSFSYVTDSGARLGFIASESKPFCGSCSRWRLSADGFLRACLMSKQGVNIRELDLCDYETHLTRLLPMKPYHRISHISEDMNQIGG